MSPPSKALSVLVLTEDGGKDGRPAFDTVTALSKRILRHIDGHCQTHRIAFEPATDAARDVLIANQYVNRRDPRRRQLYQLIAAQLRLGDGFVFHHFDADRTWAERDPRAPLDAKPIQTEILDHVRALLALKDVTADEVEAMLTRYLRLVPYREIEAWLYQNTERARALVCGSAQCGCLARLDAWRDDRKLLDEVVDPPAALPCIGKRHNKDLAAGLPVADVHHTGKSLAASVDAMLECTALLHAIERTYQPSPAPA